jgi:hypothetical protein
MRTLLVVVVLVASSVASAQPGAGPPQPYPPPSPYGYAQPPMQVQLTLDEQFLLERGYITDGQHIGGTLVSVFFGFGVGHAIQGRFGERGYMFAIGDAVGGAIFMTGVVKLFTCFEGCSDSRVDNAMNWLIVGALTTTVVRTWEVIDAATGPPAHNRKLRALHMRLGMPVPMYTRMSPYLAPARDGDGAVGGLSLRF